MSAGPRIPLIEPGTRPELAAIEQAIAAERGYIDDVIEPRETRPKLIKALRMLQSKRVEQPKRKHGNIPL